MRLDIGPVLWVVWEEQVCLKQVGNMSTGRVVLRALLPVPPPSLLSCPPPSPLPVYFITSWKGRSCERLHGLLVPRLWGPPFCKCVCFSALYSSGVRARSQLLRIHLFSSFCCCRCCLLASSLHVCWFILFFNFSKNVTFGVVLSSWQNEGPVCPLLQRVHTFPCYPCPQVGLLVTADDPASEHHYLKPRAYIRVHSWCCALTFKTFLLSFQWDVGRERKYKSICGCKTPLLSQKSLPFFF